MGVFCSCFGRWNSQTFPKEGSNDHNRELNPQKKQKMVADKEFTSLKDCLLSSPALDGTRHSKTTNGDDQLLHCHVILRQNKVYLSSSSSSSAEELAGYGSNPRGSFSKQRLLKNGEVSSSTKLVEVSSNSLTRNQEMKKRVSFKLPEVADIFIYNISEEEAYD